ncbi:MAG: monovalent cation/H(+) antiporter subunit G [Planctomycetes bacterium]|nr:monovalent cation/H(+) antiporter subunit G [Planctomycetota bacterium]
MQLALDIAVILLLALGSFFSLTCAVGVLRFPDFFSRLHPAGKNDTACVLLFGAAMVLESLRYDYGYLVWGRLLLLVLFAMFSSPIACHAITQAAYLDGLKPWQKKDAKP